MTTRPVSFSVSSPPRASMLLTLSPMLAASLGAASPGAGSNGASGSGGNSPAVASSSTLSASSPAPTAQPQWERPKEKQIVPNIERMGVLLGSWAYFLNGDTTHAKPGQWVLAYIELRVDGVYVNDKRDVNMRSDTVNYMPWNGMIVELPAVNEETRHFSIRIDLRPFDERSVISRPPITHWMAFSSRQDRLTWIRAMNPFLSQKFSGMIEMMPYTRHLRPVFGQPLSSVIDRDGLQVPIVIETCLDFLYANNAHEIEGIFRKNGNMNIMKSTKEQFDKSEHVHMLESGDPHIVAGVLKAFFQELPEPLIPYPLFQSFLSILFFPKDKKTEAYNALLFQLPPENQWLLSTLLSYLKFVAAHAETNLMGNENLSIVFAPSLLRKQDATPLEEVQFLAQSKACFMEILELFPNLIILRPIAEEVRIQFGESEHVSYGMLARYTAEVFKAVPLGLEGIFDSSIPEIKCSDTHAFRDVILGTEHGALVIPNVALHRPRERERTRTLTAGSSNELVAPDGAAQSKRWDWAPLERKKTYQKITVIDEIDLVLALCGRNSNIVAYHLVKGQWFGEKVPNTKGCHDFTYGWRQRRLHIIAAVGSMLLMFELEKMDMQGAFQFALRKEFYVPSPPVLLKHINDTIVMAFRELAEFHLLEVDTSQVEQLCGSQKQDRTPCDVIFLSYSNEYFVCFNDVGVFLDAETFQKSRRAAVPFDEPPRKAAFVHPHFILLFGNDAVSVLRLIDGLIVQKIKLDTARRNTVDSPTNSPGPRPTERLRGSLLRLEGTALNRSWKKRHLSIVSHTLLVFRHEHDSVPIDTIMLRGAEVREMTGMLRRKYSISILSLGRRVFLAANDEAEAADWLKQLEKASEQRNRHSNDADMDENSETVSTQRRTNVERGLPHDVSTWTVDHVATWLADIGVPEAVDQFREKRVTGADLLHIDKDNIKAFELSIGKRLILVKRVQTLHQLTKLSYNASMKIINPKVPEQRSKPVPIANAANNMRFNNKIRIVSIKDAVLLSMTSTGGRQTTSSEIYQLKYSEG